tara:strand:+ start:1235 stop:1612 length:378 start_codon:yes stop_codon:yes gene_type:complete
MARIYWFQRKSDKEYIPIEGEKHAGIIFHRKGFVNKFSYIGWSTGEAYKKAIAIRPKIKKESDEHIKVMQEGYDEATKKVIYDGFGAELEAARANEDKTPPRKFTVMTLEGRIHDDPMIRSRFNG